MLWPIDLVMVEESILVGLRVVELQVVLHFVVTLDEERLFQYITVLFGRVIFLCEEIDCNFILILYSQTLWLVNYYHLLQLV